jgi:hypothetical protein
VGPQGHGVLAPVGVWREPSVVLAQPVMEVPVEYVELALVSMPNRLMGCSSFTGAWA